MSTAAEPKRVDQRARILDAARALFADRGPDDVTMSDVAKAARVARATVFNHFGSKPALIEGITEGVLSYYRGMLETALADRDTPLPVLIRSLFESMAVGIEEDRRLYRSVFREIAKLRLGLDEGTAGQRAGRAALASLVHLMTRGQARAEITRRHRSEDLASAFDSLVNGTITHWLYDDPLASESLQSRMGRVADIFLHAVTEGASAPTRKQAKRVSRASPPARRNERARKKA